MRGQTIQNQKRMSRREKETAMLVPKTEYPQDMPCTVCGYRWMQHKGTLCPQRPGGMIPIDFVTHIEFIPVEPLWGDTTFLPDVAYYNQNPDFDVV
jgi:hypothetical protein